MEGLPRTKRPTPSASLRWAVHLGAYIRVGEGRAKRIGKRKEQQGAVVVVVVVFVCGVDVGAVVVFVIVGLVVDAVVVVVVVAEVVVGVAGGLLG